MDEHPGPITIRHLEMGPLLKAEAARVDSGQADPIAEEFQGGQDGAHLFRAEANREFLCAWGSDKGQRGPCPFAGLRVEELDAAQRNGAGAPRVVLMFLM